MILTLNSIQQAHLAQQQEIAALRAENERLTATPKCGRCGKREIPGVHTCTPTHWAREREAEIAELRAKLQIAREALEFDGFCPQDKHHRELVEKALAMIKGEM